MKYFEDITKAFDIALVSFGEQNSVAVALENIDFPTDISRPFISGTMLLAQTEQADLFFTERRRGIYQVDIYASSVVGSAPINRLADLINATFRAGVSFTRGNICAEVQQVSLGPLLVRNGWARRPLSVNFVTYTKRI